MKTLLLPFLFLASAVAAESGHSTRNTNTVILDEMGVRNLRIKTEPVEERPFEETLFALGRIEVYPGRRAAISSRIPGRVLEVPVRNDHPIKKGDPAVVIESRQPGNPPPTVTLEAPISGTATRVTVVPGEPVTPDRVLAEILDLSEVYALARIPEHASGKLRPGQTARISVPALPGKIFDAKLEHLGVVGDTDSGTLEAAFHVDNTDLLLRPGMRAEFSITTGLGENTFSIPKSALQGDESNRFVYVRDFEIPNAFVKTPVETGRTNDRSVEILNGLFPADEVVVRGAYSLAFAGGGTVSLKEALDAAHGHEHAADGSELTDQKPTAATTSRTSASGQNPFWMILSVILFVLLVVVGMKKSRGRHVE